MNRKVLNDFIFLILEIFLFCAISYSLNVNDDCLFKEEGVPFSLEKPIYIYFFIPHDWANNEDNLNYLNIKLMSTNVVLRHRSSSEERSNEIKLDVDEMSIGWNRLFLKKKRNNVEVKIANGDVRKFLQKIALRDLNLDDQPFLVTGLYSLVNCLKAQKRIYYNIRANSKFRVPFILYKRANKFEAFSKTNSFNFKPICSGRRQKVCKNGINSFDSFTIRKKCDDGSPSSFSRNIVNEVYVSSKAFDSEDKVNFNFSAFINLVLENTGNADFYIEMDVIPPSNAPISQLRVSADGPALPKPPSRVNETNLETVTAKGLISEKEETTLSLDIEKDCGFNKKKSQLNRIIRGRPADPRDWAWMAAILRNNDEALICGGVLITDRHVLTAAHCFRDYPPYELKVRLGEYDFGTPHEKSSVDFKIERFFDPNYDQQTRDNDIALVKLDRPTSFGEFIWPVCLPPRIETFEDRRGIVIGWGAEKFGGNTSDVLREIVIPIMKRRDCEAAFPNFRITKNMFCATLRGMDSCQGDSGGPFLIQEPNSRWYVVGIVSWGRGCGDINKPGVYTRVDNYLNWIRRNFHH